jgi:hypothetical protein
MTILAKVDPHSLSDIQKADRKQMAINSLALLRRQAELSFHRIVTGDESWFLCLYQSDHMFAATRDEVIPRKKLQSALEKLC